MAFFSFGICRVLGRSRVEVRWAAMEARREAFLALEVRAVRDFGVEVVGRKRVVYAVMSDWDGGAC